jgi:hypothetical protein
MQPLSMCDFELTAVLAIFDPIEETPEARYVE